MEDSLKDKIKFIFVDSIGTVSEKIGKPLPSTLPFDIQIPKKRHWLNPPHPQLAEVFLKDKIKSWENKIYKIG